jgi:hypothetical protein
MIVDNLVYVVVEFDNGLNEVGTSVYTDFDLALEYVNGIENTVEIRETLLNTDYAYVRLAYSKNDGVY